MKTGIFSTYENHHQDRRDAFGVAKGGSFSEQNKHFATPASESRAKMLEAMALIWKLLHETDVSFGLMGERRSC